MAKTYLQIFRICIFCTVAIGLGSRFIPWQPAAARIQSDDSPPIFTQEILPELDGTSIQWRITDPADGLPQAEELFAQWEKVPLDGYLLPLRTFTLQAAEDGEIVVELDVVESVPWTEEVPLAEMPIMRSPTGETIPAPVDEEEIRLPASPLFILREGVQRGERFVVVAISPFYAEPTDGQAEPAVQMAKELDAFIAQTTFSASIEAQPDSLLMIAKSAALQPAAAEQVQPSSPLATPLLEPLQATSPLTPSLATPLSTTQATTSTVDATSGNTAPPTRNLNPVGILAFVVVLIGVFGLFLRRRN